MGKYAQSLRAIQQPNLHFLWFHAHAETPYFRLSPNLLRLVLSYFPNSAAVLYYINESRLVLYDIPSRVLGPLIHLSKPLPSYLSYLCLDATRLFACGGQGTFYVVKSNRKSAQPSTRSAFVVFVSGKVVKLPEMRQARSGPGLVLYKSAVYVFGGTSYIPKSSTYFVVQATEKLQIAPSSIWEKLPNSQLSHFASSPVLSKGKIYLCVANMKTVEVFDPASSQFTLIPLSSSVSNLKLAFAVEDRIVLVCDYCTSFLHIEGGNLRLEKGASHPLIQVNFSSPSVSYAGNVWVRTSDRQVMAFDASSGDLIPGTYGVRNALYR